MLLLCQALPKGRKRLEESWQLVTLFPAGQAGMALVKQLGCTTGLSEASCSNDIRYGGLRNFLLLSLSHQATPRLVLYT